MYRYEDLKKDLLTDDGQKKFLEVRDRVRKLIEQSGAVRLAEAIRGSTGDSWTLLACVDRLVELREILEITGADVPSQYRVFVKAR
jgi:hypothetical protein